MKIFGIVGLGKVGKNIAFNLLKRSEKVIAHTNKKLSVQVLEKLSGIELEPEKTVFEKASYIFLAVKDSQIEEVVKRNLSFISNDKLLITFSGSIDVKRIRESFNVNMIRAHPVRSFTENDYRDLAGTYFVVEGEHFGKEMRKVLSIMDCKAVFVENLSPLYHVSMVFASNFLITLFNEATLLLKEIGIENKSEIVYTLMEQTLQNIREFGGVESLTGPIERNDINVVKRHINSINERNLRNLYILLSLETLKIAKEKNPHNNYSEIENFLRGEYGRENNCT